MRTLLGSLKIGEDSTLDTGNTGMRCLEGPRHCDNGQESETGPCHPRNLLSFGRLWLYTGSVQKVSSHVIWKIETFIEEHTRYEKYHTRYNDASIPLKVGTLGPHTVHTVAISHPIIFSWISLRIWNLFPFKGDSSFGKSQKSQGTKSGL